MKPGIVEQLGQTDLLLPARLAEGLAANGRAKLRLSVLQAAASHARDPSGVRFELGEECRAAGIDPVSMEALVNRAGLSRSGWITAPGLGDLLAAIWNDVAAMARAVAHGDAVQGNAALERLRLLAGAPPAPSHDEIEPAQVAKLTAIADADGLHRLVMDLHKALNRFAAEHAEETIAGARAYGVLPQDRAPVAAFMRGVSATARLKFSHPGLATTATRSGERLVIQNDIGENDAHVVVIAVEPDAVTVTYTDVHLTRAKFFVGLFKGYAVQWSGLERKNVAGLGAGGVFYLITGRCPTANEAGRDAFLEALGASLVFLIDWNRARKLLRNWVAKADAVTILDWAARHRFGHRGFLELGGGEFLAAAVRHAAANRIGFGEQLDRVLGRDAAVDFLKTVLRVCAEALLQGSSVRLARDRIEADLVRHLQRVDTALLAIVVRQAGLARDIVAEIARFLLELRNQRQFDRAALTTNAQRIEEKADRIALEARGEIARLDANRSIRRLVDQMEDAIDELEQAAFIASLVPKALAPELIDPLDELCSAVVAGTAAAAAGVAAAIEVPEGHRVDFEDALAAVGRLIDAEHSADTAERKTMANIVTGDFDLKSALPVIELAAALERATDRLAGFGHALREHVMTDLAAD